MAEETEDRTLIVDRRIDSFDFKVSVANALRNEGIETVGDLVSRTEAELLRIPNFAQRSLSEVKQFLVEHGLRLGMEFMRRRHAVIKGLNERDQRLLEPGTLKTILRSIEDHVNAMLAIRRVTGLNRKDEFEHHNSVVEARMRELDYVVRSWALDRGGEV